MKEKTTELVFILDRSGSMSGLEQDTIGGFNAMIAKQKKVEGEVLVSTVLFDCTSTVIHNRVPIRCIEPMTERDYEIGGGTALLDAMGGAIHHIAELHRNMGRHECPEHTIFIITTDGEENSSRSYSASEIRHMVRCQQMTDGWEFLFLGANIDAISAAKNYGITEDHAVRYQCDSIGTNLNFEALSCAVECVRGGSKLSRSWKADIEEDYRKRGR